MAEVEKNFCGKKYLNLLTESLDSYGFKPVPVTSKIIAELSSIVCPYGVLMMENRHVKVIEITTRIKVRQ